MISSLEKLIVFSLKQSELKKTLSILSIKSNILSCVKNEVLFVF